MNGSHYRMHLKMSQNNTLDGHTRGDYVEQPIQWHDDGDDGGRLHPKKIPKQKQKYNLFIQIELNK